MLTPEQIQKFAQQNNLQVAPHVTTGTAGSWADKYKKYETEVSPPPQEDSSIWTKLGEAANWTAGKVGSALNYHKNKVINEISPNAQSLKSSIDEELQRLGDDPNQYQGVEPSKGPHYTNDPSGIIGTGMSLGGELYFGLHGYDSLKKDLEKGQRLYQGVKNLPDDNPRKLEVLRRLRSQADSMNKYLAKVSGDLPTDIQTGGSVGELALTASGAKEAGKAIEGVSAAKGLIPAVKSAAGRIAGGTAIGGTYGAAAGTAEGGTAEETGQSIKTGAEFGLGASALAEGAMGLSKARTAIQNRRIASVAKDEEGVLNLVGKITQAETPEQRQKLAGGLAAIDTSGVKNYKDLAEAADAKIEGLSSGLDKALETDLRRQTLPQLKYNDGVNYVDEALTQLEEHYSKTKNTQGLANINRLRTEANSSGLRIKQIDEIAKMYGQDVPTSSFNIKTGEMKNGVAAEMKENIRTGVKNTARDLFDNPVYKTVDQQRSAVISVRDRANELDKAATKLRQKIQERSLGGKIGYLLGKVINTISGGAAKGVVEFMIPRGQGYKTLNAIDLEKQLSRNLSLLKGVENLIGSGKSVKEVESILRQIIEQGAFGRESKRLLNIKALPEGALEMPANLPDQGNYGSRVTEFNPEPKQYTGTDIMMGQTIPSKKSN